MVAEKSKSNTNLNCLELECGDSSKIVSNLNTSSSDESTKCKSDDEFLMSQSIDSSMKDESDDESKNLNKSFLFSESSIICDSSGDATFENVKESLKAVDSNSDGKNQMCSCLTNRIWKSRNVFSLSNHFDANERKCEESEVTMENITIDDSIIFDEKKDNSLLMRIRNCLAEYQESRGTSRDEYTYSILIKIMGQSIGHCLLALFYVIINIAPVLEIILHILRFIFDKIIDIKKTENFQQAIFKMALFLLQILSIYVCLFFIFGLIISPIIYMSFGIFSIIILYN